MQILPINNINNNPTSFKKLYRLRIPKVNTPDERITDAIFHNLLERANNPTIWQRLKAFLRLRKPKAVGFLYYPGHSDYRGIIEQKGRGTNWFEQHVKYRFGVNKFAIPKTSRKYYDFWVLTGKEKAKFLRPDPKDKLGKYTRRLGANLPNDLDQEEIELFQTIATLRFIFNRFIRVRRGTKVETTKVDDLTALPNILNKIVEA